MLPCLMAWPAGLLMNTSCNIFQLCVQGQTETNASSVSHAVGGDGQLAMVPTNVILIPLIIWIVMQATVLHPISGKFQTVGVLEYIQICPHGSRKKDPRNRESQLLSAAA